MEKLYPKSYTKTYLNVIVDQGFHEGIITRDQASQMKKLIEDHFGEEIAIPCKNFTYDMEKNCDQLIVEEIVDGHTKLISALYFVDEVTASNIDPKQQARMSLERGGHISVSDIEGTHYTLTPV
jgi:hypothetical protein